MENTPTYLPGTEAPKEKPATLAFVINISHDTMFHEMCEFSRRLSHAATMGKSRAQIAREYLHEHLTEYKAHIAEAINTAIEEEQKSEKAAIAEKAAFHQNKAIEDSLEFQKKLALERNGPAPTPQDATNLIEQIKNATEDAEYEQRIGMLLKAAINAGWKDLAEHLDDFPNGERILCPNSIINEKDERIVCVTYALNPTRDRLQVCKATSAHPRSEPYIDVTYRQSGWKDRANPAIPVLPESMKDFSDADLTAQLELIIAWIEEEIHQHKWCLFRKTVSEQLNSESRIKAKVMVTEPAKAGLLALNLYENPIVCDFCFHIFEHYFYFVFGNYTVSVCRSEYPSLEVKEEFIAPIGNLPVRDNWRPNGDKRAIPNYIFQRSNANTVAIATFVHDMLNEIYDWYISRMHPIEHRSSVKSVSLHIAKEETERKENLEKLAVAESEAEKSIHDGDVDCPIAIETKEEMQPLTVVAGKGVSVPYVEDGLESKNIPTRRLFRDIFSFRDSAERFEFFRELEDKCIAKIMLASSRRYDENLRSHNSIICPVALYESVPINFETGQRVFLYIYELLPSSMSFIEHRFAYPCGFHSGVPEHRGLNYQPIYQGLRGEAPTISIEELRFDRFIIWHCHSDDPAFIKEEINGQLKWIHRWCHAMCQMPFAKRKEAHDE